jgi:periplasmic copper chaperone A
MSRISAFLMMFFMLFTAGAYAQDVTIEDAWVREGPPGMGMLAGFMTVNNQGKEEIGIVAAEGPDFGSIELHRSIVENGMARMVPQKSIPVPAGGSVALKPGDYHLMLMQPKRALKAGDTTEITLILDDGARLTVDVPVTKGEDEMMMHHHHE